MPIRRLPIVSLAPLAALLVAAGCGTAPPSSSPPDMMVDGNATFSVRESVEQIQITHADPGTELEVADGSGNVVAKGTTDKLGSLMFRKIPPGEGYVVRTTTAMPEQHSRHLKVLSVDGSLPPQSFYSGQSLGAGFTYIKTRDGTTLSAYITLPGPPEMGPYPTVIDYSGYSPSKPGGPVKGFEALCGSVPTLCDAPNDPSAELAGFFGYATVSVNIRGTGCSGGAYDFFETMQQLDGYDVIEAVAAQPWVLNHKVGMVGISFPGIAQLFVAKTRPPSLAAIAPVSVIGNTATTMAPGGILNNGFAVEWVTSVLNKADPYGQGWEQGRVDAGDTTCKENQLLHLQKVDNVAQAKDPNNYVPEKLDPLNPTSFVDQINVPVFLAGGLEDEQTGPFFTPLLSRFKSSPLTRFTVYNGVHVDAYAPQVLIEWKNFLDFFIAKKLPVTQKIIRDLSPEIFGQVFKTTMMKLPPDRFASYGSYDEAFAAYQKEPSVRAIFENGAGDAQEPGAPVGAFEQSYAAWPPPSAKTLRYYLHADGTLSDQMPAEPAAASSFLADPDAGARGNMAPGGDPWDLLPAWDWQEPQPGKAIVFETPAFAKDLVLLGTASADLYVQSTATDADLQVTISEVRPDGKELFVTAGWLRASYRAVAADATELWPDHTYLSADTKPLPAGTWTLVRVSIPAFAQAFRAGSRLRVTIDTPGGTTAEWRFADTPFPAGTTHSIAHSAADPSSIALSLLDGTTAPTPLPACTLRGEPCRAYQPYMNTPSR